MRSLRVYPCWFDWPARREFHPGPELLMLPFRYWRLCRAPAASQRLDERYCRGDAPSKNADGNALIG